MKSIEIFKQEKIYGIIREDNIDKAFEIAKAYKEGGIKLIELNAPFEATAKVSEIEDIKLVQGGVITTAQAEMALKLGADMISSPIFQSNLVHMAYYSNTIFIPSVTTPNEAYATWKARISLTKIYPVHQLGGAEYIRELTKPMPFLNLLPCGSVKIDEIIDYLKAGSICVGIGRQLYNNSYGDIVKTAKEVVKMVKNI